MAASSSVPSPPPPQPSVLDVEVTIVSAKHLKNVNWRTGPLVPYAVVYLAPNPSPNHRFSTRPDDSNSTRPVWNEPFLLPYSSFSSPDSILAVDVFHSRHSETPKPLVGSLRITAASLLPDSPSSPPIVHSLDLLRPSGRPQGKVRVKVSLRELEIEPSPPVPAPALYYNFASGGSYHRSPAAPSYYPTCDYYPPPPPPPPPAHAFIRPSSGPLPRPPPSPPDYRVAHPPLVRAYGNYHHDGNSNADSVYRPSAPVDFTYPAKDSEPPDFHCTAVSPLPRLSSGDIMYSGTPPHWSSNRSVLWRSDHDSASLERERWIAPSAPTGSSVYGSRRALEEVAVVGALGGLRLDEGNGAHRSNYAYSHGYSRQG